MSPRTLMLRHRTQAGPQSSAWNGRERFLGVGGWGPQRLMQQGDRTMLKVLERSALGR